MSKPDISAKTKRYYLHALIAVAIMVFFRYLPPFGQMTALGMTVLGIFIGTLWGWINCEMIWPSVLALILLGFTSYQEGGPAAVLTATIGTPILQQILWLLVFSAILTVSGISTQLANRLVNSKLCVGRPWVLSAMIFLADAVCASFGATFAGMLLCWDFIYSISKQVGYTKEDKWPKLMIVGVVFANSVGGMLMPFGAGVVGTFGYLSAASNGQYGAFNSILYLVFMIVMTLVSMIVYFLLCRLFVKPDVSRLMKKVEVGEIQPFNFTQKVAIASLIALIVLTALPSCLPAGALRKFLMQFSGAATILILLAIITFFRKKDGKPIFSFAELASKGIFWNMLFMVGTAMTLGSALASKDAGFTSTLMGWFTPMFAGKSPVVFCIFICVITLILTNIINNAIATAIMVPIMYSFASKIGANPLMMTALVGLLGNVGLMLPCASPAGALLHSNKEWLSNRELVKYPLIAVLTAILVAVLVGMPLGSLLLV